MELINERALLILSGLYTFQLKTNLNQNYKKLLNPRVYAVFCFIFTEILHYNTYIKHKKSILLEQKSIYLNMHVWVKSLFENLFVFTMQGILG